MSEHGLRLELTVNGRRRVAADVPANSSLLVALREHFGLPGAKNACEQGECGSCTVYLDDVPVCSCLVAAGQAHGCEVRTVEGLAMSSTSTSASAAAASGAASGMRNGGNAGETADLTALSVVQSAFLEAGAVQCGFCTPGFLIAVDALLIRVRGRTIINLDDAELREALAGNLCRCTGYEKVIDAVRTALARLATPQPPMGAAT